MSRLLAALAAALLALLATGADLAAQLRPLDPIDWSIFEGERRAGVQVGAAFYGGQRAALAGAEGRLAEIGTIGLLLRLDRVAFEVGGTALRRFEARRVYASPVGGASQEAGTRRDVGDFRLATVVQLLRRERRAVALRFGTRLPTTDNRVGLERDQTDFFALLGGRLVRGALAFGAEAGVGIHGTRSATTEQLDVLLYALSAARRWGPVTASLELVGQESGHGWTIRGNEDLHEARLGVRIGERRWVRAQLVRGLAPFSPALGLALASGLFF